VLFRSGLITVTKEINEPRLPSLRGKIAAKNAVISVWSAADIKADPDLTGLAGSPTQVVKIFTPERICQAEIFEGDAEKQADLLVSKLRENKLI
jgi:electron transfer flavoprotein beta subunit